MTVCVRTFEDLRPANEHDCGFAGPGVYPTEDSRFDQPVTRIVADTVVERLDAAGFRVVRAAPGRSLPPADYDLYGKLLHYQITERLNLLTIVPHPAILLTQLDRFDAHVEYQVELRRRQDGASLMRRSFAVHHNKHLPVGVLYLNRVERGWGYVMRRLALYGWFVAGAVSDRVVAAVDPRGVDLASLQRVPSRTHPLSETGLTELAMAPRRSTRAAGQPTSAPRPPAGPPVTVPGGRVHVPRTGVVRQVQTVRHHGAVRIGSRVGSPLLYRVVRRPVPTVAVVRRPVPTLTVVRRPVPTARVVQRAAPIVTVVRRPAPTVTVVRRPAVYRTPSAQPVVVVAPRAPVLTAPDPSLLRPASTFQPSSEWEPL